MAQNGHTPLHIAAVRGNEAAIKVVETLLAAKADVNAKNDVRGGRVAWRARGGAARNFCVTVVVFRFDPEAFKNPNPGAIALTVSPKPLIPGA